MKKSETPSGRGSRALGLTRSPSLPVYHQLYVVLKQQIIDEIYSPETPLPSEFALGDVYKVSRVTVRRTLKLLETEGLIERRRGVGTFAIFSKKSSETLISGGLENLITIGFETTAKTLALEEVSAPALINQALKVKKGEHCICVERLRMHKGLPFSLTKIWLPQDYGKLISKESLGDRPVVAVLEDAAIYPTSADQSISAILADDICSEILNIDIGAPLIRLRRTVFNRNGTPLLHQLSLYTPERYEYQMMLTRGNHAGRPQWKHID
ncbi:MAG: GntR family transcriptional regulator [Pseudomonadales bacterium]|jgi:GntR family transcriptional regulator|tara:strand:- start:2331 stop:3134 length:804 start_codon:yes stop_codon:yes gene_type:complete